MTSKFDNLISVFEGRVATDLQFTSRLLVVTNKIKTYKNEGGVSFKDSDSYGLGD